LERPTSSQDGKPGKGAGTKKVSSSPEADKIIIAWGMENLKRKEQGLRNVSAKALKEEHTSVLKVLKVSLIQSRWCNYLNPSINASPFTPEEDEIVITNVPEDSTTINPFAATHFGGGYLVVVGVCVGV
jgi:hypothetical protein